MERRRRFIEAYIANVYFGARAARAAGCPAAGARVAAYRMLREPDVQKVIEDHFKTVEEERERQRHERELAQELASKQTLAQRLARLRR